MIQDINEHEFPAGGGWAFRQPQTNWVNPMAMVGFNASVQAIIKHRKANPVVTMQHKLATEPGAVSEELKRYTRLRLGLPLPPPPTSFFRPSHSLPAAVVAVASDLKRAAQGTKVVADWFQSGGMPVAPELASKRAAVCAGCKLNVPGAWYTEAPGQIIKFILEARKDLNLQTPDDEKLRSCDVCKCLMRVKVHTPLEHIVNNTKPEILKEFPEWCWIAKRDA